MVCGYLLGCFVPVITVNCGVLFDLWTCADLHSMIVRKSRIVNRRGGANALQAQWLCFTPWRCCSDHLWKCVRSLTAIRKARGGAHRGLGGVWNGAVVSRPVRHGSVA